MRFIIPLGLTILLAACGTTTNYYTQTVQSWNGSSLNSLASNWGQPDVQKKSPNGQVVYVYKTESYTRTNAPDVPSAGITYSADGKPVIVTHNNPSTSWAGGAASTCTAFFIADKKGTIVETKVVGNGCYGGSSFANRMANPAKSTEKKG